MQEEREKERGKTEREVGREEEREREDREREAGREEEREREDREGRRTGGREAVGGVQEV